MALRVGCTERRARALFALGFPLRMVPDVTFLHGCVKPRLFVQGEHDRYGGGDAIRTLTAALSEPRTVRVVAGADHFFEGHLDEMQEEVRSWAANRPWSAA